MRTETPSPSRELVFTAPFEVTLAQRPHPAPPSGHVLVKTLLSAVSPGTELLVFRGQFPKDSRLDTTLAGYDQNFSYPVCYGYALVGEVTAAADDVGPEWLGRKVFAFHPHASHAILRPEDLIPIPNDIPIERAAFYATLETALTLVWDANPLLGEKALVMGAGVIGSLTAALLEQAGIADVALADPCLTRLKAARNLGVTQSFLGANLAREVLCAARGFDLIVEVTGVPESLNQAVALAGFGGRIVVGSFYGEKSSAIALGDRFHRNRLRFISSQVSTLPQTVLERFDRQRRTDVVWDLLRRIDPTVLVSHVLPLEDAPAAYERLDAGDTNYRQVFFSYDKESAICIPSALKTISSPIIN